MKGRIIYSSGGNYKVKTKLGTFNAKPLGLFRKNNTKLIVGDFVDLKINSGDEINVITKLYSRKNEFLRPNISNVDYAIITISINKPTLDDFMLDKLIAIFQIKNVEPILLFTKADLGISKKKKEIINEYIINGYKTIISKNKITDSSKSKLKKWLFNKLTVITGQSGVGKTNFINLITNLKLKTDKISESLGRGKNTTTHSEIFELFPNIYVIDTPGFSSFEFSEEEKKLLPHNFFNFEKHFYKCKFNNCKHLSEGDCEIKRISSQRILKNYKKIMNQ